MNLKKYLISNGISQAAFAKQLDVDRSAITHWINGKSIPMKKHIRAIERLTYGKVTASDFERE